MKIEEFDPAPLKENVIIIPIIPKLIKKPKKSSLVIKPLNPYQCKECQKICRGPYSLKEHISLVHDGKQNENRKENENPLVCWICNKQSSSRSNLNEHIRVMHKGEPRKITWKCNICENSFLKSSELRLHLKKAHDRPFKKYKGRQNKKWICYLCNPKNDTFQRELPLIEHLQTVHDVKYKCSVCKELFTHNLKLTRHYKDSHPDVENPYECKECQKTFRGGNSLNEHISLVHKGIQKEKPHLCQTCGKSFTIASKLEKHVKIVHDKIQPQCPQCDEKFKSFSTLYSHIAFIHKGKTFDCKICDAKFLSSQSGLRRHMNEQHGDIPRERFKCEKCEKVFFNKSVLKKHVEKIHEGKVFTYQCLICQEIFTSEKSMRSHNRYDHEGKKLDECPTCKKKFKGKHNLRKHIECVHEKKYPYLCTLCGKHFQQTGTLKQHIDMQHDNKHANEIHQCQFCGKSFNGHPLKLKNHVKYNHEQKKSKIPCPMGCKGAYFDIQKHIDNVHEKKNLGSCECKFCNKTFMSKSNLKTHVRIVHEGARPFGCEFCGKTFTTKQHRDLHVKREHERMKQEIA